MVLKSINPYTNQVIKEFEEFSDGQIEDRLMLAHKAFEKWRKTTFEYRKQLMLKAADQLSKNVETLGHVISSEMGKTIAEAKAEVKKCAWVCEHYANDAKVLLQKEAVATEAHLAFVQYEPLGTILGIMPWNFPFWQVFRFAAPTLMAGNTVLLKHASNVQLSAQAIEDVFEKAGFPKGTFQNLVISSGKVGKVIEHDVVKAVTLTGSEFAGSKVAELAGSRIKKTVLELGGSNAFIVLNDADIDKAVDIGIGARMQNAGQSCIAAKRFIIHEKISQEFMEKFSKKINELTVGDPLDAHTDIGPLSSIEQAEKVAEQVRQSVEAGAQIIAGGYPEKALYPPTLLTGVKPGMPVFDEEVFGPVAPIIIAKNTEEAIKLSNRSDFGLGVSLFTNDLEKAEQLIPEFEDGAVFVNALVKSDPRLPFGGTKHSGYGRELAVNGIREFVNVKTVYIDKFHDKKHTENENVVISTGRT
jgi:succinate-semialdehyde dehydrogenase / glutarate-semialdehyde dehydrogenase